MNFIHERRTQNKERVISAKNTELIIKQNPDGEMKRKVQTRNPSQKDSLFDCTKHKYITIQNSIYSESIIKR